MSKKKMLFIVNPISGGKSKTGVEALIHAHIHKDLFDYEIETTQYAGHAKELLHSRLADFDIVVAVGGDGTVNEIAQILVGTDKVMAMIPMGSGNGLARHLQIPLQTKKAIEALGSSVVESIDTASLNGHFFASIAGIGFDSLIAAEFEKAKGRGFVNYARLTMREYFKYQEQKYDIVIDGKKYQREAAMISFANSNQFGYNTVISPDADISDGLLDVCILKKPRKHQIPLFMKQIWAGQANQSPLLEIIKARRISIQPNENLYANIDGESIKVGKKIEVELKPRSLNMMKAERK